MDNMIPDVTKWMQIAEIVMKGGFSPCIRDGAACKMKWNQLVPEYKRIADYLGRSGQNIKDYWNLTQEERKEEGLPIRFSQEFFMDINEWYAGRAQINPLHVRDVHGSTNTNFLSNIPRRQHEPAFSDSDSEDPIGVAQREETVLMSTEETSAPPPHVPQNSGTANPGGTAARPRTTEAANFGGLPAGVTPQVISSSNDTGTPSRGQQGNTGVKRKTMTGPALMADATRSTGMVMAMKMQTVSDASLQVERSKVELQMKMFQEQMIYQRERDIMLHETSRLTVMKQHEMVGCLKDLTAVLASGLNTNSKRQVPPSIHDEATYNDFRSANMNMNSTEPAEQLNSTSGSRLPHQHAQSSAGRYEDAGQHSGRPYNDSAMHNNEGQQ